MHKKRSNELLRLADELDRRGLHAEADEVTAIVHEAFLGKMLGKGIKMLKDKAESKMKKMLDEVKGLIKKSPEKAIAKAETLLKMTGRALKTLAKLVDKLPDKKKASGPGVEKVGGPAGEAIKWGGEALAAAAVGATLGYIIVAIAMTLSTSVTLPMIAPLMAAKIASFAKLYWGGVLLSTLGEIATSLDRKGYSEAASQVKAATAKIPTEMPQAPEGDAGGAGKMSAQEVLQQNYDVRFKRGGKWSEGHDGSIREILQRVLVTGPAVYSVKKMRFPAEGKKDGKKYVVEVTMPKDAYEAIKHAM